MTLSSEIIYIVYSRLCDKQSGNAYLWFCLGKKKKIENDIQTHTYITKLHHQLFWINWKQGGYAHHTLSALSFGKRLLQGLGENQGSQLLHWMDFLGYYLCLHSFILVEIQGLTSHNGHRTSTGRERQTERERERGRERFFIRKHFKPINVFDVTYRVPCYAKWPVRNTAASVYLPGSGCLQWICKTRKIKKERNK